MRGVKACLKVPPPSSDTSGMDYHMPKVGLLQRARTEHVVRRVNRRAHGFTTRDFHRNERLKQVCFLVLTAAGALGAVLVGS